MNWPVSDEGCGICPNAVYAAVKWAITRGAGSTTGNTALCDTSGLPMPAVPLLLALRVSVSHAEPTETEPLACAAIPPFSQHSHLLVVSVTVTPNHVALRRSEPL